MTKPPVDPKVGRYSSVDDPETWGTFAQARAAAADGVGFVFTAGDGLAGVDLDDCIDPQTAEIAPWAAAIISQIGVLSGYVYFLPTFFEIF
jgi:putative DNA primase/helicase